MTNPINFRDLITAHLQIAPIVTEDNLSEAELRTMEWDAMRFHSKGMLVNVAVDKAVEAFLATAKLPKIEPAPKPSKLDRVLDLRSMIADATDFNADFFSPEDQKAQDEYVAEYGFKKPEGEDGVSIYVGRMYPTLEIDPVTKKLKISMRLYHEPFGVLCKTVATIPVYISSSVSNILQQEKGRAYQRVIDFVTEWAKTSQYPHVIVPRKGKIFLSKMSFDEHPWVQHFAQHCEVYRNEALAVAFAARGIIIPGNTIKTPAQVALDVPDGVYLLLKKSTGEKLGYYPGMWQGRLTFPFVKGLMVVWHDDSITEFFNTDTVKLKMTTPEGKKVMESIPEYLTSDQMLYIANSDVLYDMRISHQAGYMLKNTIESEGGAWGDISKLIANAVVKEIADKTHKEQEDGYLIDRIAVEELMPDYIRTLVAAGFPRRFLGTIQQIQEHANNESSDLKLKSAGRDMVDTILLAARPKIGKMAMFASLPKSYMGGMKVGWYKPDIGIFKGHGALSTLIGRVPFLAVGGGIQRVEWAGISPLPNTIIAIVEDITPSEHAKAAAAAERGEKYKRKDGKLSQKIWQQIMAMGADSDGDRLVIMTNQGEKMLMSAGLVINEHPQEFKTKLPYPGINGWTPEMIARFWIASTPRVLGIGQGDTPTRDANDLYKEGLITWETFQKIAVTFSAEVQLSASASKYWGRNAWLKHTPLQSNDIKKIVGDNSVGLGRKFHGLLWDEAREKAEAYVLEYLPEKMEIATIPEGQGFFRQNWKGGYTEFHDALRGYSPDQGVDWPSVVRNAFFIQLTKNGITREDIKRGLKGKKLELVHQLIRKYIATYPHRINVWCWFLDERLTKVEKDKVLSVIGLPFEPKEEK